MTALDFTADAYADDVIAGRVTACEWVRLAAERYRADRDRYGNRPGAAEYHFDERAARLAVAFFPALLRHSKGEYAGRPVGLEPWQQFQLWNLFGWKRDDGARRFRTSYVEVARKNGKSTIAAGVGLYLLVADGEPGAEVYTAATKRDQAKLIHSEAIRMVKQSPKLSRRLGVHVSNIHDRRTFSKYEPLGADSTTLDGLNVHAALADELHAWKSGDLWDVLETATGARRQPLLYAVTTAGHDRQSLCFQFHNHTRSVLRGLVDDPTWFGVVYTLDENDDGEVENWNDPAIWLKANPNLGISKRLDDMAIKAARVKHLPARLGAFLQKELNVWSAGAASWINWPAWERCGEQAFNADDLVGRVCYGGLDLSSNTDLTAFVLVFPPVERDPFFRVLSRQYIPLHNLYDRARRDRVPYEAWHRDGQIVATAGNVIDYDHVLADIVAAADRFDLVEIAFDRWGASRISTELASAGLTVVEFGQGYASMSPAMNELERLILSGDLQHGGDPVLSWNASNLVAEMDPAGNIKPSKRRSRERIDGVVALIMAVDRATRGDRSSVYDSGRDLFVL